MERAVDAHQQQDELHFFDERLYGRLMETAACYGEHTKGIRLELLLLAAKAQVRDGDVRGARDLLVSSLRRAYQCGSSYSLACFLKSLAVVAALAGDPLLRCLAWLEEARATARGRRAPLLEVRFDVAQVRILVLRRGGVDDDLIRRTRRSARAGGFLHQLGKLEDAVDAMSFGVPADRQGWIATFDP